jgi:hypothetical protein
MDESSLPPVFPIERGWLQCYRFARRTLGLDHAAAVAYAAVRAGAAPQEPEPRSAA